jgi:aspartyl aminopeptidase
MFIHQNVEAQMSEDLGAYAEMIMANGQEKAATRFPSLAELIEKCLSCKSMVKEILNFLHEDTGPA